MDTAAGDGSAAAGAHTVHPLTVAAVEPLTDEAVKITFAVPAELRGAFRFAHGQHVAIVRREDGEEVRRSYSVCSPAGGPLSIGVKRLAGGRFSGWAQRELRAGDVLEVLPPAGRFTVALDPAHRKHYVAIAAGSGITPVISILETVLAAEPLSRATLVYGNRTAASIMFLEEVEDLKDRHPTRFQRFHVLSREAQEAPLLHGRIDAEKVQALVRDVIPVETVDEWLLCGPLDMTDHVHAALVAGGAAKARIHRELFHVGDVPAPPARADDSAAPGRAAHVTIVLDGRTSVCKVHEREPILDAILRARPDAPYACKGGVCGTCRCRVTAGEVRMDRAYALEDHERDAGIVLACQAHPVSERVALDFDAA
ncbi:MAG TPA: 1,2-phenylacetyl-CoA epoxidase subunit PaaE [Conexibacter sp.]|nr:1,2-phenylacetyl-CoA epoxidase subunit PaaE [Conexibacter sp.]